jgi:hypothetical protein
VLIGVAIDSSTAADMQTLGQPRHAEFIQVNHIHERAAELTDVANRVKIHLRCSQASTDVRRSSPRLRR